MMEMKEKQKNELDLFQLPGSQANNQQSQESLMISYIDLRANNIQDKLYIVSTKGVQVMTNRQQYLQQTYS